MSGARAGRPGLAVVLATASTDDAEEALALAVAARRAGHPVAVFAMADGVAALADPARVAALVALDCDLCACATSVDERAARLPAEVRIGGQDDHAAVVAAAARVVAFT